MGMGLLYLKICFVVFHYSCLKWPCPRFVASSKCWSDTTLCAADSWVVRLRLDSRPPAQPHLALAHLPEDLTASLAERISRATGMK